ncbi:MAG TPA: response regulator transcription factor [Chloroflexota bacterium]
MTTRFERPIVLVVEDDPYIREVIRCVIEDEGFPVVTAADGQAALALLHQHRPVLAILDWMLPKGGGAAVLAGLRQIYRDPPPVVVISAIEQAADKARQSGAIAFIRKPFELEEVVAVALRAIEGRAEGGAGQQVA